MKAAVLYQLNDPLRVEDQIEIPALNRGQVLVRMVFSGVCHSQICEIRGQRGPDAYLPHLLGHEGTGVVDSIGPDVSRVKPGDPVILGWIRAHGIDAGGSKYRLNNSVINGGAVTTFNNFSVVSENRLYPLPEGVPMDVGALFGCAVPTGAGMVLNTLPKQENLAIGIWGLGGIGLIALAAARTYNPRILVALDLENDKLEIAKKGGATDTFNPSKVDVLQEIMNLTDGKGLDYSFDAAGLSTTIEQAFQSLKRAGGICTFASHPKSGSRIQLDPYDLICGKQIRGTWGGGTQPDRDIPRYAALYLEGLLPLKEMITKRYSLEKVNEAVTDLENRKAIRPLIEFGE